MGDLKKIPYVGKATQADLLALGYEDIASLKGADPDDMYEHAKALGRGNDRRILYVSKLATAQTLRTQTEPS